MSLAFAEDNKTTTSSHWPQWLMIAALVYLLLVAVATISSGFKAAAGDQAQELFAFASNPITAMIIGTVATALIQSSSTVTSIIVGLVAGGLPVSIAIPMVMGANIWVPPSPIPSSAWDMCAEGRSSDAPSPPRPFTISSICSV